MKCFQSTLALLYAVACLPCAISLADSPTIKSPLLPVIAGQSFAGIIVPRSNHFADSWTPTESMVLSTEPKLPACVLSQRRHLRSSLAHYFRHYSGVTVDGRKELRVDFFDTRHFPIEQVRQPLVVCDGDSEQYFVVLYNLEHQRCSFLGN